MLLFENVSKKEMVGIIKKAMKLQKGFLSYGRTRDQMYNVVVSKKVLDNSLQSIYDENFKLTKDVKMAKSKAVSLAKEIVSKTPKQLIKMMASEDAVEKKVAIKEVSERVKRAQAVWSIYLPKDKLKKSLRSAPEGMEWDTLMKSVATAPEGDSLAVFNDVLLEWMTLDAKVLKLVG